MSKNDELLEWIDNAVDHAMQIIKRNMKMIRFIDISKEYFPGEFGGKACAFLNFGNGRFLKNNNGEHLFYALWEIEQHPLSEQLLGLVPENFFTK